MIPPESVGGMMAAHEEPEETSGWRCLPGGPTVPRASGREADTTTSQLPVAPSAGRDGPKAEAKGESPRPATRGSMRAQREGGMEATGQRSMIAREMVGRGPRMRGESLT